MVTGVELAIHEYKSCTLVNGDLGLGIGSWCLYLQRLPLVAVDGVGLVAWDVGFGVREVDRSGDMAATATDPTVRREALVLVFHVLVHAAVAALIRASKVHLNVQLVSQPNLKPSDAIDVRIKFLLQLEAAGAGGGLAIDLLLQTDFDRVGVGGLGGLGGPGGGVMGGSLGGGIWVPARRKTPMSRNAARCCRFRCPKHYNEMQPVHDMDVDSDSDTAASDTSSSETARSDITDWETADLLYAATPAIANTGIIHVGNVFVAVFLKCHIDPNSLTRGELLLVTVAFMRLIRRQLSAGTRDKSRQQPRGTHTGSWSFMPGRIECILDVPREPGRYVAHSWRIR
ncbi:hypothetical protein QBC39DRAFT_435592 [Podospora conica]|nr:hypothetical protein QBC39DRAFT_435592 [Schizothecium conicum]